MKFRFYSLAAIAGSLIAGSVFAQGGTTASQPAMKSAAAGETAKIETVTQDKAPAAKAGTATSKATKGEPTKMAKKHKHVAGDASVKHEGGAAASVDAKHEVKKESAPSTTTSATASPKASATATPSGK